LRELWPGIDPVARGAGLLLRKVGSNLYEIGGSEFVLRIRKGTGHRDDLLVTVTSSGDTSLDLNSVKDEIGLGAIAQYYGAQFPAPDSSSITDFDLTAATAAQQAQSFILPILTGENKDFLAIKDFIKRKIAENEQSKSYRNIPNVREEWT
jgi:hypothetical protein